MKIERVDEKTVKCFLSNEELEQYNIDYKDFVLRSDRAREILKEIIEHAEDEVGYKAPQFAFDLQIMMVPDQGMVLTFSEKEPFEGKEGEQIMEYLREMKNVLQRAKEKIGHSDSVPSEGLEDAKQKNAEAAKAAAGRMRPDYAVFAFGSLGDILKYASAMPSNLRVKSELYKMDGIYYLYMAKGAAAYERYSRACVQALEFGGLYSADDRSLHLLREHGDCVIAEKALRKLNLNPGRRTATGKTRSKAKASEA